MSKVCMVRCVNYDPAGVDRAVARLTNELGVREIFRPGEKILLKPNLLSAHHPDDCVTTHPQIFASTARVLIDIGCVLSFGDSPAMDSPKKAARVCGMEQEAEKLGIAPADFDHSHVKEFPEGTFTKRFIVVDAVRDNDSIINISKFKSHAMTRYTGAMKNLFGLIPGLIKARDHVNFPDPVKFSGMIADLNKAIPAKLHITDGIMGMEGNGPANGTPRAIGWLLGSRDPVALDSVCVMLMGLDYREVDTLVQGELSGVGIGDPDRIELTVIDDVNPDAKAPQDGHIPHIRTGNARELLAPLIMKDFVNALNGHSGIKLLGTFLGKAAKRAILHRPVIRHERCTRCKVCVNICPVDPKAIYFSEKKNEIRYRYQDCIRCFCCQETCPFGAIEVQKAPLGFLLAGPVNKRRRTKED